MKLDEDVIHLLEVELGGLRFGSVELKITMHDGRPCYKIRREFAIKPGKPSSGARPAGSEHDYEKK